ncbi:thioesterase family protein [Methylobacterium oryzihabitans]|jgi:acyl-CoA thioester hydrolase|uniref:Thioesterase n=1 Tax=Methylobacterium oryzihabitans TaxID=2499852 RepID=A0A437P749_9HYPH|nr:thioesterase family protein [Methylobacterium oryzihabitans]RVU18116.1 thioesterase [Methylobacterium oryzihabitans]
MVEEHSASIFFFAPFVSSTQAIDPGWIDYNGHLNMAYYHVLFDRAVDEAFGIVGLGPDYSASRNATFFAAETHVRYRRELTLEDRVRVTVQLIDFDDKRLHFYSEIRHAFEGWVAATSENLSLHIDGATRRVAPFPDDILANLTVMRTSHARLPRPEDLGRVIGIPGRGARNEEPMIAAAGMRVRH